MGSLGVVALILNVLLASRCVPERQAEPDGGAIDGGASDAGVNAVVRRRFGSLIALPGGVYVTERVDGTVRLHLINEAIRRLVRIKELPVRDYHLAGRVVGSRFVFVAEGGEVGNELWRTDGTAAGTGLLADINAGPSGSNPTFLSVHDGWLYLAADDGIHGSELWRTDGTAAGTALLGDINPGPNGSNAKFLSTHDRWLYFLADDGIHGEELWRTDGTAAGTGLVADAFPGAEGSSPQLLGFVGDRILFAANDGVLGQEPRAWSPDGGLELLGDLVTDGGTGSDVKSAILGGHVYFTAPTSPNGRVFDLWQTDGTSAGTTRAWDTPIGSGRVTPFEAVGGALVFVAASTRGLQRWVPGEASPEVIYEIAQPGYTVFREPDRFYYQHTAGESPYRVWVVSDGTKAGSSTVAYQMGYSELAWVSGPRVYRLVGRDASLVSGDVSIHVGLGGGLRGQASWNDRDYLLVFNQSFYDRLELWVTDGTRAGTFSIP